MEATHTKELRPGEDAVIADLRAKLAESESKLAASKDKLAESESKLASSEDNLARQRLLHSLTALVSRFRNVDGNRAIQSSSEGTPSSGTPAWTFDPLLFDKLHKLHDPSGEVSRRIADAVRDAGCTSARRDSSERPSEKCQSPHDVHSHVRPAVSAAVSVLAGSQKLPGWNDDVHPRHVRALYEQSYNNHGGMPIPDHSAVFCDSSITQLTPESQVGVMEDKVFLILQTEEPCEGELQLAGYAAQPLFPPIACGIDLGSLRDSPLSSFGVYTDSTTSTAIEVRVGSIVEVFFCRMPFLPGGTLPERTACVASTTDSRPSASGVVTFGLGVMAALRDARLRATGATAEISAISPLPAGVEFPRDANARVLGRGKFARVVGCGHYAVKIPLSRQAHLERWSTAIRAEAGTLQKLFSRAPPCRHFPVLAVPVPSAAGTAAGVESTGISDIVFRIHTEEGAATASQIASLPTGTVQGLVTGPLLTMLPQAINELRSQLPLAERSVPALVTFALAIALPLLSAQEHARTKCKLSHGDAHAMNVGLEGWDAGAAVCILRACSRPPAEAPTSLSGHARAKRPRLVPSRVAGDGGASLDCDEAGSFAAGALRAMCRSVVLNDWGSAKSCGVRGFPESAAVAIDTAQVVALVGSILRLLLDDMTNSELHESCANPVSCLWWAAASVRCRTLADELRGRSPPRLDTDDSRRNCILYALGLTPMAGQFPTTSPARRMSPRFSSDVFTAAASATGSSSGFGEGSPGGEDGLGAAVEEYCVDALAATTCTCYADRFSAGGTV